MSENLPKPPEIEQALQAVESAKQARKAAKRRKDKLMPDELVAAILDAIEQGAKP